jgi:hypothetical protein
MHSAKLDVVDLYALVNRLREFALHAPGGLV